jgi:hypothetical protein
MTVPRQVLMRSVSLALLALIPLVAVSRASAQQAGSQVIFIVPQGTPISPGDVIVYVGQPQGSIQAGGCAADNQFYPIQNVVITDPGGGRATRFSGLITIPQTAPVANGTRLGNLAGPTSCLANGISYDKFLGTVE